MKTSLKLLIIGAAVALAAAAAADPLPVWNLDASTACTAAGMEITLQVDNFMLDPGSTIRVYRRTLVPGLDGPYDLTAAPVDAPPLGGTLVLDLVDPDMDAEATGFCVVEFRWPDGSVGGAEELQLSCRELDFLVRGYLLDNDTIMPCDGVGMLECAEAELFYAELNEWVGSNELLDFYGVATRLDATDDCAVQVLAIEPVGPGAVCGAPVPATAVPWGALKAQYR